MKALEINEQLLIFRVGPIACCVNARDVDSIVNAQSLHRLPRQADFIAGVLQYRDTTVSIVSLFQKFALPAPEAATHGRFIMAYTRHGVTGFWVDEIIEITSDFEQNWSASPSLVEEKIFDQTLLWHDKLVLNTDFDRLFSMQQSGKLNEWASKDEKQWGLKKPGVENEKHVKDISSEDAINDLVNRGAALSQPVISIVSDFDEDELAFEESSFSDLVIEEHEIGIDNVFAEKNNSTIVTATETVAAVAVKSANDSNIAEEISSEFQHEDTEEKNTEKLEVVVESQFQLTQENINNTMINTELEGKERNESDTDLTTRIINGDQFSLALAQAKSELSEESSLIPPPTTLPLEIESLSVSSVHDDTDINVMDEAFEEMVFRESTVSLDFISEEEDASFFTESILSDGNEYSETSKTEVVSTSERLFEEDVAEFFSKNLREQALIYKKSMARQKKEAKVVVNEAKAKTSELDFSDEKKKNLGVESEIRSKPEKGEEPETKIESTSFVSLMESQFSGYKFEEINGSQPHPTDVNLVSLSDISDEIKSMDNSVFDESTQEISLQEVPVFEIEQKNKKTELLQVDVVAEGAFDTHENPEKKDRFFEEVREYKESQFDLPSDVDAKKEEAVKKVLGRIEQESSGKKKRSPLRLVASVIFVASGVFLVENYELMDKFTGADIPPLVLLTEAAQVNVASVEQFSLKIETVSEKFGSSLSVTHLPNSPILTQASNIDEQFTQNEMPIFEAVVEKNIEPLEQSEAKQPEPQKSVLETAILATKPKSLDKVAAVIVPISVPEKPQSLMNEIKSSSFSPVFNAHNVVHGDTLWAIAGTYLNNPFRYPELAKWSNIKNPDLIYPGNKVKYIPFSSQDKK